MITSMKLNPGPFEDIKSGSKTIEVRLYDEKRRMLNLGDIIEFSKLPDLDEKISVQVVGLLRYSSFRDLVNDFLLGCFSSRHKTKDDLLKAIYEIYSKDEEKRYGVLGIRITGIS